MGFRQIRIAVATVVAGALGAWSLVAPSSADTIPEACGYVAADVPAASVDTTLLLPTTTDGQAICTTKPCGEIWQGPHHSEPQAAFDSLICLKD